MVMVVTDDFEVCKKKEEEPDVVQVRVRERLDLIDGRGRDGSFKLWRTRESHIIASNQS